MVKASGILDAEARREVICEIETLMQEDGPIVQPLWRGSFSGWDKRVKGFAQHPTTYMFVNELWIDA